MRFRLLITYFFYILLFSSCSTGYKTLTYIEPIKGADSLEIHEGILSRTAQRINYIKDGKEIAVIELSTPVMVAMADQEEEWGYFQFPIIGRADDGTLVVTWQMKEDSHIAYGKNSDREYLPMMSNNGGLSWIPQDKNYNVITDGYSVVLDNGALLEIYTPSSKNIHSFNDFPVAIAKQGNMSFYKMINLPEELQGVYFQYKGTNNMKHIIHAKLNDPELLRYAIDDMIPIVWWGNIKKMSNKTLIAGVYPGFYLDCEGKIQGGGVSFYNSLDDGVTWSIIGKILFNNGINSVRGENEFTEPVFEILCNGTLICVMRTGSMTPMYKSFSFDKGKSWTTPVPFTSNGVKPRLLLLNNGVLVLASGRPGIQLRFSIDGNGEEWTDAIDMIPLIKVENTFVRDVSCGYASILEAGDDSFYIVYSDFTTKNSNNELRKSIWFRKVTVKRK